MKQLHGETAGRLTSDEIVVLNYVASGLGGPNSIVKRLRPTFQNLIKAGLIEEVTYFVLSSDGQEALEVANPPSDELATGEADSLPVDGTKAEANSVTN